MDCRTTEMYSAIIQAVKDRVPNLRVTKFTCDFEAALVNSIRQHFINVRVVGCWFHMIKASILFICTIIIYSTLVKVSNSTFATFWKSIRHFPPVFPFHCASRIQMSTTETTID